MYGVVAGEWGRWHMFAIREHRTDFSAFSNEHSNCALHTFPGLRRLLICPPSLGNEMDGLRFSCIAPSKTGPKAPKEKGWHLKELGFVVVLIIMVGVDHVLTFHNAYLGKGLVNTYWTEQPLSPLQLPIELCVCSVETLKKERKCEILQKHNLNLFKMD